jgi:excisionase family DNA binding protein
MLTKPLLTTHDVADLLKMKEATVRRWIRDGELPAILIHREWRVSMKHLEEFVEARLKNGAREDIKKGRKRRQASVLGGQDQADKAQGREAFVETGLMQTESSR